MARSTPAQNDSPPWPAASVQGVQLEAGHGVPGEVGGGGEHGPDGEALEPAAQHGQRPGHGHGGGQDAEGQHPQRPAAGAEHPLGDGGGGAGDHEQLEGGPAQVLDDVAGGGEQRAAHPQRGPVQHHGRHAGGGGGHGGQPEQGVADHGPDHGGGQGRPEAEGGDEQGPGDQHEQADAEVAPEDRLVEEAEAPQLGRDRLDAPLGGLLDGEGPLASCHVALPSPVLTGSGSKGRRPLQSASQPGPPGSPGHLEKARGHLSGPSPPPPCPPPPGGRLAQVARPRMRSTNWR